MADKKEYSPEDVAKAILQKCSDLYKNSTLAKANTSHEIESGAEPHNDDAETPEELEAGEVANNFGADKKKKKKKAGDMSEADSDGDGDIDGDDALEDADKDDDGDIDGDDAIEAKEEESGEDLDNDDESEEGESAEHKEDKKKEKKELPFEKTEKPLAKFLAKREKKKAAVVHVPVDPKGGKSFVGEAKRLGMKQTAKQWHQDEKDRAKNRKKPNLPKNKKM